MNIGGILNLLFHYGYWTCTVDPAQENLVAIQAFARVGFVPVKNSCLMILHQS